MGSTNPHETWRVVTFFSVPGTRQLDIEKEITASVLRSECNIHEVAACISSSLSSVAHVELSS